ncbi:MAG TPA: TraR/DksA family transcriptional regulator [Candidatus Binataceae bacterium]|nr:TraR/DksA family transcriptional regulator [Candidatus Binataceae bacterium]
MGLAMTPNSSRLGKLRDILARLRDETYQRIVAFRRDQGEEVMTSPGDEMDVARSTSDVETHASLIERAEDRLRLIDQSLARVDNGTYGTCAECGEDIPVERLKALPFALLCVDCQEKRGRSRGRWGAGGTIEPYSQTWTPPADMEAEDRKQPNSYGVMEAADAHAEDPFGPIDEPTGEEPKRRRGRPRKNKD